MPRTIKADGRTITVPDDATPEEINQIVGPAPNAGASAKPADTRNAIQRGFDALTTVTPEQEAGHSWLTNKAQEFGAGTIQGAGSPFVHPVETVEGLGQLVAHPIDTAKSMWQGAKEHPAQTLGNILGGAETGELGGKLLSGTAHVASEPMQAGGGGLIDRAAGSLKSDFAHGAQPGRAYLEGGGTPAMTLRGLGEKAEGVKEAAGQKLGEAYDEASRPAPPNPVRGLLPAPQYDVPLAESPRVAGRLSKPTILEGNRAMQRDFPGYGANPPAADTLLGDVPGEGHIPDEAEPWGERFNGMRFNENIGERPGTMGGGGVPQGVLRTRDPEMAGQVMSPEEPGTPFPMGATRIPASAAREALLDPVNRLRAIQNGPGGVGASSLLDDYESGIRGATGQDFTPRSLFDLKRNVAANTRWNDPTMFDMNSVRQQGVGRVGSLLTDAVPEAKPLNRIYQGSGNLAERANLRADTGSPPFTSLVNRGLEGAAGLGLGYMTHNPLVAAAPLLMDSVPVKTGAGYLLYQGGKLAGKVPNLGPIGAGVGAGTSLLPQETQ